MKIILVGIGKMGSQIASRLIGAGHSVVAIDPNPEVVKYATSLGCIPASSRIDALSKLGDDQAVVWLMIPANFVTSEVGAWVNILPKASILIDGGNTDYRETKKHGELAEAKGVMLVDVGVSGGILGAKNGFSMMAGGNQESYRQIVPILDALALPSGGHNYFGPIGAGHYVKMTHNAIEYGVMESLAEGYDLLKNGVYKNLDLAKVAKVWQQSSVIQSTLNGLIAEIMTENQNLQDVTGVVAESGEAKWTLETAQGVGVGLPAIKSAFDVRIKSQNGTTSYATKILAKLRNKFGGHPLNNKENTK